MTETFSKSHSVSLSLAGFDAQTPEDAIPLPDYAVQINRNTKY